jgi:hypothetical protein
MREQGVWVARQPEGDLWCYFVEPRRYEDGFGLEWGDEQGTADVAYVMLHKDLFPEVTFENSPKRLVVEDLR